MPYITLVILIAGLLMYLLASNGKAQELGRLMFFAALLALAIVVFAPHSVRLLR